MQGSPDVTDASDSVSPCGDKIDPARLTYVTYQSTNLISHLVHGKTGKSFWLIWRILIVFKHNHGHYLSCYQSASIRASVQRKQNKESLPRMDINRDHDTFTEGSNCTTPSKQYCILFYTYILRTDQTYRSRLSLKGDKRSCPIHLS